MRAPVEYGRRRPLMKDPVFITGIVVLYLCVFTAPAYAYLDPGTGSFLFQLLVGAVVGGIFVIKSYWLRLKNWFSGTTGKNQDPSAVDNSEKSESNDSSDSENRQ